MKIFTRRRRLTYGRLILVFLFFMAVNFLSMYFYDHVLSLKAQLLEAQLRFWGMPPGEAYAITSAISDIKYHTAAYVYHTTLMIALFAFFIGAGAESARSSGPKEGDR